MKKIILFVFLIIALFQINNAKASNYQNSNFSLLTDTLIGADTIYYVQYKPAEITSLIAIATQCPLSGGQAVYQARATLQAEHIWFHVNDDSACIFYNPATMACCQLDSVFLDTIYCIGHDANGNYQHQFKLHIKHKCDNTKQFNLITSADVGSITDVSTNTINYGSNTVYGVFTQRGNSNDYQFCLQVKEYGSNNDTCLTQQYCWSLANSCTTLPPCNFIMTVKAANCEGMGDLGNSIHYLVTAEFVSTTGNNIRINLTSPDGIVGLSDYALYASATQTVNFDFEDTLSFDGYTCINAKLVDIAEGNNCQSVVCFPLNSTPACLQQVYQQNIEACIDSIHLFGYSTDNFPKYEVYYDFMCNGLNIRPHDTMVVSVMSSDGTISAITPTQFYYVDGNTISGHFTFVDYDNTTDLCVTLILTNKSDRPINSSYAVDYTNRGCLCISLPVPNYNNRIRKTDNSTNAQNNSNAANTSSECAVKIIPNPNQGKPQIYYKISYNDKDENADYTGLQLMISESSTGKIISSKPLLTPAGIAEWWETNPLPQGYYIVSLQQNGKLLCHATMEVIK